MSKRASSRPATPAAKKARNEASWKANTVAETLYDAVLDVPGRVCHALSDVAMTSLTVSKEDRHPFQEEFVGMIGKALSEIGAVHQKNLNYFQAKLDGSAAETQAKQDLAAKAHAAQEAAQAAVDAAVAKHKADVEAVKTAQKAAKDAKAAHLAGDAHAGDAQRHLEEVQAAADSQIPPLKEAKAPKKRPVQELVKTLERHEVDSKLLRYWAESVYEDPADRGGFGAMVQKQVDAAVAATITRLTKVAADGAAQMPGLTDAVTATEAAVVTATEVRDASEAAIAEAKTTESARAAEAAEADATNKAHLKVLAPIQKQLESATSVLTTFQEGPLAAFTELKDLTYPVAEVVPDAAP